MDLGFVASRYRVHREGLADSSIDLDYVDPRPQERKDADERYRQEREEQKNAREEAWQAEVDRAKEAGLPEPEKPEDPVESPVRPDWGQSPVEVSRQTCCLDVTLTPGGQVERRRASEGVRKETV